MTTKDIKCSGCLSDDLFMHCKQCDIRDCIKKKDYEGCHQCDEFPCKFIDNFSMAVGKKVILRSVPYRKNMEQKNGLKMKKPVTFAQNVGIKFLGVL